MTTMPEKDPTSYPGSHTHGWSAWHRSGGLVGLRKRRQGIARPFNLAEFLGEIAASAPAGLLTFYPA